MGVGQPGMHRQQRDLDAEGQQKGGEQEDFGGAPQGSMLRQLVDREGVNPGRLPVEDVEDQQGDEHHQAAGQGVQQELDGRVDAVLVPPDAHQEEHGDDLDLPKEVKEQQIGGQKEAGQGALQEQDEEIEGAVLKIDGPPGDEHAEDIQKGDQRQEQEADAVQAQAVAGPQPWNPGIVLQQQPGALGRGVGLEVETKERRHQGHFHQGDAAD